MSFVDSIQVLGATFWDAWPKRVEAFLNLPENAFFYGGAKRRATLTCANSRGKVGVTADPGLAQVFHSLCDELKIRGGLREALARVTFSDRLHFVFPPKVEGEEVSEEELEP